VRNRQLIGLFFSGAFEQQRNAVGNEARKLVPEINQKWNHVGMRTPTRCSISSLLTSRADTGATGPSGNAADSSHLATMVKEQITNTGIIPLTASADDGYSTQQGRDEVLGLGLKVVSISGAKGKKIIEAQQWKSQPYRQARADRSAMESLVFTLKEGFEFGQMVRRTHDNVLAEMLEKVLAYNVCQIIRGAEKAFRAPRFRGV
jgi:hypothetical protein